MLTYSDKLVRATAQAAFWQNYETWGSYFEGLYMTVDSNSVEENFPFLGYAPKMAEMLGTPSVRPVPEFDFTIKNKKWSAGVPISYELRRFGRLNAVAQMVGNLGEKARRFNQYLLTKLIEDNGLCYDGQNFFDTDHSDPGATYTTAQSNSLTYNAAAPLTPTDVEFAAAAGAAIDALYGMLDNEGDPVVPGANAQIILMVPSNYKRIAEKVEKVDQLTGPVGNDMKGAYKTVVNPFLTKATSSHGYIYAFVVGGARKPFIEQTADPLILEDNLETTTRDSEQWGFQYGNVGYGDWRYGIKQDIY